jgi:ABC-type Na+ efflux pump permease subunit
MNLRRLGLVCRVDLLLNARRPLFWIFGIGLLLTSYGLSSGNMRIQSGDSTVGGTKAWLTSEFAVAQLLSMIVFVYYSFFIAVAAGMAVIRDDELKVGELLHATSLRPKEYVWGKFSAVLVSFIAMLIIHLYAMMFFYHIFPNSKAVEFRGPWDLMNYVRPAIVFALPIIIFLSGTSFAIGELTRKPILVFVLPVALVLVCGFFLWTWSPNWLDPRIDRILMLVDPSGFRWLTQTWLKVDRGVEFYNHARIPPDTGFLLSRLVFVVIGLAAVVWSGRHMKRSLRGSGRGFFAWLGRIGRRRRTGPEDLEPFAPGKLADLGMRTSPPGFLRGMLIVARAEFRELRSSPGLYLFVPLIILEMVGVNEVAVGAFGTPLLQTPGTLAVSSMNTLTVLVSLLLLFYVVESVLRERHTGLASILYATPVRSTSILFGKCLANGLVGVVILLAALAACAIILAFQGIVPFVWWPFLLCWGGLLVVTFVGWTAFVMAVLAITRNRYTTYGVALAALIYTGYRQFTDKTNWVGNWDLWNSVRWSDMGVFELDRSALILNRLLVLSLGLFFVVLAVRFFPRREFDGVRVLARLRPASLFKSSLRLLPFALVPLGLGIALYMQVDAGFEGESAKKRQKDYWRRNVATWRDIPLPALTAVDIDLELEPARQWFHVKGSFVIQNIHDKPLAQVPLTGSDRWQNVEWTMDDKPYTPDNRSLLYVFTPPAPLAPNQKCKIGFSFQGSVPGGISKNGGKTDEFILPSGVVLTSFRPSIAPVLGYIEEVGIDDDNRYDAKEYPDDFYEGITDSAFGSSTAFTTRVRITGPAEYTYNSTGTKESDEVANGRRTVVWQSDVPMRFFNVVAGKWAEKHGKDTVVFYHPEHTYNIPEISEALDAARKYYSEWFYVYPWRELKLSEFPNLSTYAQGFATDITFSEGIGFLTLSEAKADLAFMVTAHEAAHQWWGNILVPGKGPGGNILSEGMAHFSTILLTEQVKGLHQRMEFCKRIEGSYNENRKPDSEKPLVKTDGSRPGDTTVTYDKGGWVFWMLLQHMGRERMLHGLRAFIEKYRLNRDHPVLQDFVATMRPFAPDAAAYDAFVKQWFFEVNVPEYKLTEAKREEVGGQWHVSVHVENVGTGRMMVDLAAATGDRFNNGDPVPGYQDSPESIELGPKESKDVVIRCNFKPDRVLVDPDARVLQLQRKFAIVRF